MTEELSKGYAITGRAQRKELNWRSEKAGPVKNKDGVYEYWWDCNNVSKGGSTLDTVWWSMDFEETPKP